jgi:hypothetical protein
MKPTTREPPAHDKKPTPKTDAREDGRERKHPAKSLPVWRPNEAEAVALGLINPIGYGEKRHAKVGDQPVNWAGLQGFPRGPSWLQIPQAQIPKTQTPRYKLHNSLGEAAKLKAIPRNHASLTCRQSALWESFALIIAAREGIPEAISTSMPLSVL